jgi:hypothetical protein
MACSGVKHVTFERCAYLDVKTLSVIMDHMPELTSLGVYSCELIHLGCVDDILHLVGDRNGGRIQDNKDLIDLDIAPPLRQGPIGIRKGSYGITHSDPTIWNNFGTDMGRALTAKLVGLERAARRAHVVLFIPGKAFRSWLDKLPLQVNQLFCILEAVANFLDYADSTHMMAPRMIDTVQMDLVIAATASPLKWKDFDRERPMLCAGCCEVLPGAFFRTEVYSRSPENHRCEGCELTSQLEQEKDGNKDYKRALIRQLWDKVDNRDDDNNDTAPLVDLDFLLSRSDQATRVWDAAMVAARRIPSDKRVKKLIARLENEREALEDQAVQLDDYRLRRPINKELDRVKKEIQSLRVRLGEQEQPRACAATSYDWDYLRRAYVVVSQVQAGSFTINGPYNTGTMDSYLKAFCMYN